MSAAPGVVPTPSVAGSKREERSAPGPVETLGGMGVMFGRTVRRAASPPLSWGPEFAAQLGFTLKLCFVPLVLVAFALSFGPAGVQGGNFFDLFGAFDRMGAAWQLVVTRLFAPMTTAIILAGVAGTAICADLGARVVREETAALEVMGIEPVKSLVVPRFMVLLICAVMFNTFALVAGMAGALLVLVQNNQPFGPFLDVFLSNANLIELGAAIIKSGVYGAVIATVCCYKGLTVSGGAEGVGRAVNQAVVICFLSIAAIDYVLTQFVLATNPILSVPRG